MDTNEEKARKLAISYTKGINENGVEVYDVRCEGALQEMAEWKDIQCSAEKKRSIEEKAIDISYLQCWYQDSINETTSPI